MKSSIKGLGLLLASALVMTACNNDSTSTATTGTDSSSGRDASMSQDSGNTANTANSTAMTSNSDMDFINYAVPKNTKELAWLKAGIEKGTNKELKAHAKMMQTDHKKLDKEVSDLVGKKSWTAPSVDTSNVVDLTDKMGKDWDKAWTDKMVSEHEDLLSNLEKYQKDVKDEDLRALITKTIPVVKSHLDMAKAMQDKMK